MPFFTAHVVLKGIRALLCGFAQIFLQQHPGCGLLVLLAISIGAPYLLAGALLGGLASMLVARHRGYPQADINIGLYGYNGILLGLLLSLQLAWTPLLPVLIIASAGLSSLLLAPWMRRMRHHDWLPAFTFPFVLLGWSLLALAPLLSMPATPTAAVTLLPPTIIELPLAILRGLGQVIFLDAPLAGLCLLLGLLVAGRRAALWAVLGSSLGFTLAWLYDWPAQGALIGLYGYNATLAAIALAQVHRNPVAPICGVLLALVLQPGFAALGLPALTMPFILACWLVQASQRRWRQAVAECAPATPHTRSPVLKDEPSQP